MASKPVERPIATWAPSSSPLHIEYSTEVMEEMRARATEGFYRLSRGGVEIAGLLLGVVQRDSIRILAQLPFEIEYAYGPIFALSPRDTAYVRKLLEDLASPEVSESLPVRGYRVLGLYVSHSRSGMALTENELALFQQLFPHAWQSVLVLKPSRSPETAGAFFVRETNGEIRGNQAHEEFVIKPAIGDRRARPASSADPSLKALADAAKQPSLRDAAAIPLAPAPPKGGPPPGTPSSEIHEARMLAIRRANQEPPPLLADAGVSAEKAAVPETKGPADHEHLMAQRAMAPPPPPAPVAAAPAPAVGPPVPNGSGVLAGAPTLPEKVDQVERTLGSGVPDLPALPPERPEALRPEGRAPAFTTIITEADRPPVSAASAPPAAEPVEDPAPAVPRWDEEEVTPGAAVGATHWLRWAIPTIGMFLLLVLGYLVYHALNSAPPSVVFYTRDAGDRLEVIWQLKGLSDARSAVISIQTGGEVRTIDLIRTGQLSGTYSDAFVNRESKVTLAVERSAGEVIQRTAPLIPSDSVVAYLGSAATSGDAGSGEAGTEIPKLPANAAVPQPTTEESAEPAPDIKALVRNPAPILATPVESSAQTAPPPPVATVKRPAEAAASNAPELRQPTAREELERRSAIASPPQPVVTNPRPATLQPREPEAPVQARITELPAVSSTPQSAQNVGENRNSPRPSGTGAGGASGVSSATPPPNAIRAPQNAPAVQTPPPPVGTVRQPTAPAPAAVKPTTARVAAGRMIWTGQLRKNQSLQISGKDSNQGVLNAALPGQPVNINVLPGELTSQGLVVYTANPRYRNAQNAVEAPGPTNGWNQTRYRYDPARANSLIVTGIPNRTNGWQGITVRNDDKSTNVIVIDWQAAEP